MQDQSLSFGGGLSSTQMHPIVMVGIVIAVVCIFVLPKRYIIVPALMCPFLIPMSQQVVAGGFHFYPLRIVILCGWLRLAWLKMSSSTALFPDGLNAVDKVFIMWTLFRASAIMLLFQDSGAVINQFGFFWDTLGGYFLLRALIQDREDIYRAIKSFAFIGAVLGVCMLNEKYRGQNLFGYLGGMSVEPIVRDGAIRARGDFAHPILAGVFGATLLPMFFILWHETKAKFLVVIGVLAATAITIASASSTPLLAYLSVLLVICFWPMRRKMRMFRWGLVAFLILAHLSMKAPVWFLIAHVDLVAGNSGYHRAELIDHFVRNFSDWWLIGTNGQGSWGADMWDLSNQFVAEGETGGLATIICFIAMISMSFGRIGTARKITEAKENRNDEWLLWILGTALFSHIVAYFGVSYFDQTKMSWFFLLVAISVVTTPILATKSEVLKSTADKALAPSFAYLDSPGPNSVPHPAQSNMSRSR